MPISDNWHAQNRHSQPRVSPLPSENQTIALALAYGFPGALAFGDNPTALYFRAFYRDRGICGLAAETGGFDPSRPLVSRTVASSSEQSDVSVCPAKEQADRTNQWY